MAINIDSMTNLVGGLNLSSDTTRQPPRTHPRSLADATRSLTRSINAITQEVESLKLLAKEARATGNLSLVELCSLRGEYVTTVL
jgi:hypothetical protein